MKTILLLTVFLLLFMGCDDFFEKDISGKTVTLIAPGNGVGTLYADQTFVWEEVEGASEYRLVVVSPAFDSIAYYVLDTVVNTCSYRQLLNPGRYEWQVTGRNSAWNTAAGRAVFTVLEPIGKEEEDDPE